MIFPYDNPWIFHRDEIDLLEEEVDDLYRQHKIGDHDVVSKMEDRILQEQLQTEELSEAEWSLEVGLHADLESVRNREDTGDMLGGSLKENLKMQASRDPLYERLYLWVKQVFDYTTKRYVVEKKKEEDLFRVRVNVNMILIKFAAALMEKMIGDPLSERLIEKDRKLCFTYFIRTLDSLQHCAFLGDQEASQFEKDGRALERMVRLQLL